MKKVLIIFILWFAVLHGQVAIKSLKTYTSRSETELPVLQMNSNNKLNIYFEVEAETQPSFNIIFKFCDAEWQPYDNNLLTEVGSTIFYNVDVQPLPFEIHGANYFVNETFPTKNIKFNVTGKWMFFITDKFDDNLIYDYGKFFVVGNKVKLNFEIDEKRREGSISDNNARDRVINFEVNFAIPYFLDPFRIEHIEIIKNNELNNPIILDKDVYSQNRAFRWDAGKYFSFIIKDVEPGSEYRQIDTRSENRYPFPKTKARFSGIEYSEFYKQNKKDLNGGFLLMDNKNIEADYLETKFEFKPHKEIKNDIFIVGSFTNWEVLPRFKLKKRNDIYTINIELKRGKYDYQYVTGNIKDEKVVNIDWRIFEGNFWDTENIYSIFLFYKSPINGEYDEIIGYKQIVR
ncbi:MAG: hypothetical protein CR986_08170 [Ignavibacteriae bacterium]|nr:MAG: hypothetical protein CR986_08170 [Ignavibacteriota bacterium]